ncbi:MAG: Maf family protein, partial [Bacteroidota bacterium]|nr:Maf family protein [Bacteroidota bacterium]
MLDWKILLASQSPRRRDLIQELNLQVEIVQIPETDESFPQDMDPFNVPVFLAKKKALEFKGSLKKNEVLLTA